MQGNEIIYDYLLHDLRVQTQLLLGNVDWLMRQAEGNAVTAGGADVTASLLAVRENAHNAGRLLDTMLKKSAEDEICDIAALIERVRDTILTNAHSMGKRCAFEISGDPMAAASAQEVERVLYNLVSNAIRHTSPGATIKISAFGEPDSVILSVEDDGPMFGECEICILEEEAGRQCDKTTGMGLKIVRALVDRMNGSIQVGSCGPFKSIRLRLPAYRETAP